MWKKVLGALAACFFLLRWSRRLLLVWRIAGRSGAHFVPGPGTLALYFLSSGGLLVGFWKSEGTSARFMAIAFVALQIASIAVLAQLG